MTISRCRMCLTVPSVMSPYCRIVFVLNAGATKVRQ